ncbi:hypothetical protein ADUPG1_001860, partial [Aduncisulcus paluster]
RWARIARYSSSEDFNLAICLVVVAITSDNGASSESSALTHCLSHLGIGRVSF